MEPRACFLCRPYGVCVITVPPLRGSENLPTRTVGLRPRLTQVPPLCGWLGSSFELFFHCQFIFRAMTQTPTGLIFLNASDPALQRWAIFFRPAGRDSAAAHDHPSGEPGIQPYDCALRPFDAVLSFGVCRRINNLAKKFGSGLKQCCGTLVPSLPEIY